MTATVQQYSQAETNGLIRATEADQLPHLVHYGAGNVTANPRYRNTDL